MLTSIAYAASSSGGAAAGGAGGTLAGLMPLILMFAVFYFLLIRPQQKRNKEHKAMLASVERGTHIVTVGGMFGRIVDIDGDVIFVNVSTDPDKEIRIKMTRGAIGSVYDPKAVAEEKKKKAAAEEKK